MSSSHSRHRQILKHKRGRKTTLQQLTRGRRVRTALLEQLEPRLVLTGLTDWSDLVAGYPYALCTDESLTTPGLVGSYVDQGLRAVDEPDWSDTQDIAGARVDFPLLFRVGNDNKPYGSDLINADDGWYDFNRDKLVNATDQIIARNNRTSPFTALKLVQPPLETEGGEGAGDGEGEGPAMRQTDSEGIPLTLDVYGDAEGEDGDPLVGFRLEAQDANGNLLQDNTVYLGDEFRVQVYVRDLRLGAEAQGVFAAYLDIAYSDGDLFSLGGTNPADFDDPAEFDAFWTNGPRFPNGVPTAYPWTWTGDPNGIDDDSVPDEFDEVGAVCDLTVSDGNEYPLVYVTLVAERSGTLTLQGNPADWHPHSDIYLWGTTDAVPVDQVEYGSELIVIIPPVNAHDDVFPTPPDVILEDADFVDLDVLANDVLDSGSTGTLTLDPEGLMQPANGVVVIAGNQIRYMSNVDFFGVDTFSYRATDGLGSFDTATVTVRVTSVNDPPIAEDDWFVVLENSAVLDVLLNDRGGPFNEDQTLTIDPATLIQPAHGTLALINGDTQIQYTRDGYYFGVDVFEYSVIDSEGLSSGPATVTLGIEPLHDLGDAPAPYPTLLADDGAGHTIVSGFHLGASIDSETDGQPSPEANADDCTGSPDDEDGVVNVGGGGLTTTGGLIRGDATAQLDVLVTNTAGVTHPYLDAWIDSTRTATGTTWGS